MPDIETIGTWEGRTLLDRDGGRIGIIDAIYLDDRTGEPGWALVNAGLFGAKSSFAPLAEAFQSDNDVVVLYDKQLVRDAPRVDPDGHLSEVEERQLWRHYGLDYDTTDRAVTGPDAIGRGRVRLRKYVTTEQVEQIIPVRWERVAQEIRKEQVEVQDEDGKLGRNERRRRR
jgi:hypothetical protein